MEEDVRVIGYRDAIAFKEMKGVRNFQKFRGVANSLFVQQKLIIKNSIF